MWKTVSDDCGPGNPYHMDRVSYPDIRKYDSDVRVNVSKAIPDHPYIGKVEKCFAIGVPSPMLDHPV